MGSWKCDSDPSLSLQRSAPDSRPEGVNATMSAHDTTGPPTIVVDEHQRRRGPLTEGVLAEEDRLWTELHALVDSLPPDKVDRPGYFREGWSAKDLVAHIGTWLAEAAAVLERIRFDTYRREEIDIDAMNQTFFEAMQDVPFHDVRLQGSAARNQMLRAWGALERSSADADWWIRKAGPEHYAEHVPRLREWVIEVRDGRSRQERESPG
jgi:hypothetical protein